MSSLRNAFTLIELIVAQQTEGATFTEILQSSQLPRSSAHRILKQLTELNVLTYDEDRKTYRGGFLLATLGAQVTSSFDIRQNSRPALKAMHNDLGYVVTLSVCGEESGIYIDKIEDQNFGIRLHSEIGKSFPLHCTAMGKIHLAYGDATLRDHIMKSKLEPFTEQTITTPSQLKSELARVRDQGFAIDDEEISRGLTCIAAPIFGLNGDVIAALSLTAPTHIYDDGIPPAVISSIIKYAQQASIN